MPSEQLLVRQMNGEGESETNKTETVSRIPGSPKIAKVVSPKKD